MLKRIYMSTLIIQYFMMHFWELINIQVSYKRINCIWDEKREFYILNTLCNLYK